MSKPLLLLLVVSVITIIDQVSKYVAKYYLENAGMFSYLFDTFRLVYSENTGAFLGLGSNLSPTLRTIVFSGVVSVVLVGFTVYVLRSSALNRLGVIAGGLIIGGGGSNLIDRLVNDGAVMDFMNMGIGSLRTGIFNIADMAILLGVACMLLSKPETAPKATAD